MKLIKINKIEKHTSHDIEVEDTHCFFANGVLVHNSNGSVVKYKDRVEYQSRESVLSLHEDNSGFMNSMITKNLDFLFEGIEFKEDIAFYGEWCGKGIMKNVAVNQLPKMFVIFGCKIDDVWVDMVRQDNEQRIFHITQFPTFEITIDFNQPELSLEKLTELTLEVEKECPVGKHFDVSGTGEGIVWIANHNGHNYRFKTKGDKHAPTKTKEIVVIDIEMVESIKEFVENTVTENRLEQGISWLIEHKKELTQKSTGDFLRWVVGDIIKEEDDTIEANKIDEKKLNTAISNKARNWFFSYLDELVFSKKDK
jgi:hypothetical protein